LDGESLVGREGEGDWVLGLVVGGGARGVERKMRIVGFDGC